MALLRPRSRRYAGYALWVRPDCGEHSCSPVTLSAGVSQRADQWWDTLWRQVDQGMLWQIPRDTGVHEFKYEQFGSSAPRCPRRKPSANSGQPGKSGAQRPSLARMHTGTDPVVWNPGLTLPQPRRAASH